MQDITSKFTAASITDELNESWAMDTLEKDVYVEAVKGDPLNCACYAICAICASGIQCNEFTCLIAEGNRSQWFKSLNGKMILVPNLQLLHDVKIRWDSTFYMLNHIRTIQPAVDLFVALPSQQKDLTKHKLSDAEWTVLQDYETILNSPSMKKVVLHLKDTVGTILPAERKHTLEEEALEQVKEASSKLQAAHAALWMAYEGTIGIQDIDANDSLEVEPVKGKDIDIKPNPTDKESWYFSSHCVSNSDTLQV
ncbi:hypothetical protein EDD15DRAFT_2377163 [Pisolithus albus]|nr:hypothetical protein EDD15DRAFT_2377163 [Pisolithus albus]